MHSLLHLNYLAVFGTAVIGFLFGWLWYSPVLFSRAWMAEMKFTEETMKAAAAKGMGRLMGTGFAYTLLSTVGLALLLRWQDADTWINGGYLGLFIGIFFVAARQLNGSLWEQRSLKLQAITVGHELALFTLQGVILGVWN